MTDTIADPQTGPCHVTMWPLVAGEPQGPGRILGIGRWEDLLELAERPGSIRHCYDLFDIPDPDGTLKRYRAFSLDGEA